MKLKIERIDHYDKNSQGVPYTGKYGAYSLCRIQTTIDGVSRTISGIDDKGEITKVQKDGNEIEVEISTKKVNDNVYYNFRLPNQNITRQEFDILAKKVKFLEDEIGYLHKKFEGLDLKNKVEEIDLGPEPDEEVEAIQWNLMRF